MHEYIDAFRKLLLVETSSSLADFLAGEKHATKVAGNQSVGTEEVGHTEELSSLEKYQRRGGEVSFTRARFQPYSDTMTTTQLPTIETKRNLPAGQKSRLW